MLDRKTWWRSLRDLAGAVRSGRCVAGLELRINSRRRRTYVLRLAYLGALTLFAVLVWAAVGEGIGNRGEAFTISRMAEAGKEVACRIIWFVFVAAPLAAILLMSNAFGDELRGRTLAPLMSTPLTFENIVVGKFLSRMLQLAVLILATLPVLAIARVFGGVPWAYVLGGVLAILAFSGFAGAVTMLYSAVYVRPYKTILASLAATAIAALPAGLWLAQSTGTMLRGGGGAWPAAWPVVCAVALLAMAAVLARCVRVFRLAALRSLGNDPDRPRRAGRPDYVYLPSVPCEPPDEKDVPPELRRAVRAFHKAASRGRHPGAMPLVVSGSPIVWRTMRGSLMRDPKIAFGVAGILLGYCYFLAASFRWLHSAAFHTFVLGAALLVTCLLLAAMSATAITSEKESGCWPLLLATPLTDGQILAAKLHAVFWRAAPAAGAFGVHAVVSVLVGRLHPVAGWNLAILLVGVAVFVAGLGLHVSARFRRTAVAATVTAAIAAGLWVVLPSVVALAAGALGRAWDLPAAPARAVYRVSPFVQVSDIVRAAASEDAPAGWRDGPVGAGAPRGGDVLRHAGAVLAYSVVHVLAGVLLLWRAARRFRRHVF